MDYPATKAPIDDETLPQTQQEFNAPEIDFDKHKWIQQGYEIIDSCPNCIRQGIPIPSGKMLVKEKGEYRLIDELRG